MSLLTVTNLSISFHTRNGVTQAVKNLSFSVNAGETLGIVGESGSGKSVTCYALLDLIPTPPGRIDTGQALFLGEDLLDCNKEQMAKIRGQAISMIFQDPMTSLNPYLTIGEQLIEPLIYHKNTSRTQAKTAAIALLNEVGILNSEKRYHSYPHELSGGMQQRVMIAIALISEPKLLICDEPTTALDVTIQAQILTLISELQKRRNIAVIFITHDLAVVADIADKLLVMNKGVAIEQGDSNNIFANPQQEYTRKLINAVPSGTKIANENPTEHQPLIEVTHLNTWFKDQNTAFLHSLFHPQRHQQASEIKAVNEVSFTINKGEILGVVGESGSGKSTLGRSILGLVPVTSGDVYYHEQSNTQNLTQLSKQQRQPWRRKMQMIFQDPYASLNPRMTVFETLAEPLLLHGIVDHNNVTQQVLNLMDEVGLARGYIRKYPHEFSGGQRQRIAIGRAIATKPEFIVADEPVSALDVTIQAQILDLILDLVSRHNLTMMFISHDLSVVRYIADRLLVMLHGEVIEQGNTEFIWQQPQQQYTQNLLKSIPKLGSINL